MLYGKIWYVFLFIFLCVFFGCMEEERIELGKVKEKILRDGKVLSYYNSKNVETIRVKIFDKNGLYEIKERTSKNDRFFDSKPIHCILVAINHYKSESLSFCREDIQELDYYLRKHFASYNQEVKIDTLYDQKATRKNLKKLLDSQVKKSHLYSTTLFAFSGHGNQKGLELYDKDIAISQLKTYFKNIQSRRVIWILDCCSSGSLANDKGEDGRKIKSSKRVLFPQESRYNHMHCFLGQGKILICSSLPNQESKDGIFIKALVSNIKALEQSDTLKNIVNNVRESIRQYNKQCTDGCEVLMTPFSKLYGDIRIGVMHYPNEY